MMTMKLTPNVPVDLPLTAYYGITFMELNVGNSGITSCVLKIGDKDIHFKASDQNKAILKINGDPNATLTYRLKNDNEKMVLGLPNGNKPLPDNGEILLHHYLSYSVPWKKNMDAR